MKKRELNTAEISDKSPIAKLRVNPFLKLMKDQEHIAEAFKNGEPLSSLEGIKFIRPFQNDSLNSKKES